MIKFDNSPVGVSAMVCLKRIYVYACISFQRIKIRCYNIDRSYSSDFWVTDSIIYTQFSTTGSANFVGMDFNPSVLTDKNPIKTIVVVL
ncbi:hypothetical protein [Mucilaginibacter sp.]|uniref:hypothetical protein n=1 Tax=Mucilaginibacter sp. TaxID=1882438 RepID=UPI00261DD855|nr:hypothetical protein [Mucilaginibacter sp.]